MGARVLAVLGDSVTTDHISPAGLDRRVVARRLAGSRQQGVSPVDFNQYGARRGHHEVMMRGTFGNIRLRNRLVDGKEGPYTLHLPDGEQAFIYDAAMRYRDEGVPLLDPRGQASTARARRATGPPRARRCSGSGRSSPRRTSGSTARTSSGWACCRSSSSTGESAASLGLTGTRVVHDRPGLAELRAAPGRDGRRPRLTTAPSARFQAIARLDGPIEVDYLRQGGILPAVLRRLAAS